MPVPKGTVVSWTFLWLSRSPKESSEYTLNWRLAFLLRLQGEKSVTIRMDALAHLSVAEKCGEESRRAVLQPHHAPNR